MRIEELIFFFNPENECVKIGSIKIEVCKIFVLIVQYNILWIYSDKEKQADKGHGGYLKALDFLAGN